MLRAGVHACVCVCMYVTMCAHARACASFETKQRGPVCREQFKKWVQYRDNDWWVMVRSAADVHHGQEAQVARGSLKFELDGKGCDVTSSAWGG